MDSDIEERARRAYQRHCTQHGLIYSHPCAGSSQVEGDQVVLRNINGEIARYQIVGDRLRRVAQ